MGSDHALIFYERSEIGDVDSQNLFKPA
jgi:hypothetical protein